MSHLYVEDTDFKMSTLKSPKMSAQKFPSIQKGAEKCVNTKCMNIVAMLMVKLMVK